MLDMCNDDDVPLFTKKTFCSRAAADDTKEADIKVTINAGFHWLFT
jgi:hypothetical protein